MNWELLEHRGHCAQRREFYIAMGVDANQERSLCFKISNLSLTHE